MTKEEKELLVKDLSARLPYGVKVLNQTYNTPKIHTLMSIDDDNKCLMKETYEQDKSCESCTSYVTKHYDGYLEHIKPFLRPISSMTKEEEKEYFGFYFYEKNVFANTLGAFKLMDWLNTHHFDYRGLIEKGLALKAAEEMYNTKTNKETIEL